MWKKKGWQFRRKLQKQCWDFHVWNFSENRRYQASVPFIQAGFPESKKQWIVFIQRLS